MQTVKNFFVIEGPDGSGKSTVTELLASRRTDAITSEVAVYATKEPTVKPPPKAGPEWFWADREVHVQAVQRRLAEGEPSIVLCDRYEPSTMVYQRTDWPNSSPFPQHTFFLMPSLCALKINLDSRPELDDNDRFDVSASRLPDYFRVARWMASKGARVTLLCYDAFVPPLELARAIGSVIDMELGGFIEEQSEPEIRGNILTSGGSRSAWLPRA